MRELKIQFSSRKGNVEKYIYWVWERNIKKKIRDIAKENWDSQARIKVKYYIGNK